MEWQTCDNKKKKKNRRIMKSSLTEKSPVGGADQQQETHRMHEENRENISVLCLHFMYRNVPSLNSLLSCSLPLPLAWTASLSLFLTSAFTSSPNKRHDPRGWKKMLSGFWSWWAQEPASGLWVRHRTSTLFTPVRYPRYPIWCDGDETEWKSSHGTMGFSSFLLLVFPSQTLQTVGEELLEIAKRFPAVAELQSSFWWNRTDREK